MSSSLALLLACVLFQAEEQLSFSSKEGNFKLTYPNTWTVLKSPNEHLQLVLRRGTETIVVSATETNTTIEEILDDMEQEEKLRADTFKEVARTEVKVAGERGLRVQFDLRISGIKAVLYVTVFTHQGIAYRVNGVRVFGDAKEFEKAYSSILDSFSFREERKEWLAKFRGKPARTALLGGLVSFDLNRPRWRETTFEDNPDYTFQDSARFQFLAGGGWAYVKVREAKGDAAAELESLRHWLESRLQDPKTTPTTAKGRKGPVPCVEVAGQSDRLAYVLRGAVFVEDGMVVQVIMDNIRSQREVTRADWEQLLAGLVLQSQSKPDEPPAFPRRRTFGNASPDPGLAVFLPRATRVSAEHRGQHNLLAVAPDGARAVVRTAEGCFVEHLVTHKRDALPVPPGFFASAAWSRDGKRVALAGDQEVLVITLESKRVQKVKGRAAELAFGPGPDELLVCTAEGDVRLPRRGTSNRLERINLSDNSRRDLIEFPLSRFEEPAVSPDGKRIALVTNRDYPRTSSLGGHLYVCAADGSGLRQLTKEPEHITAVAWSDDGRWIYAVRRLAVGERGEVGMGGSSDLYRIAPETGEAVNLTRSGHIGRAWAAGPDLLFETLAWHADESQRGVFRIAAAELEKATAARPVPPVPDPRVHARAVAEKVQAALGSTPLKEAVPAPELLEKLARAFADAAGPACGHTLDFGAASLDRLARLADELDLDSGREPAAILGFGAYYGETLRKAAGAEWKLKPVPFGEWLPGRGARFNPLVNVVLPFSEPYGQGLLTDEDRVPSPRGLLNREQGQKLILVYPPQHAEDAVREAAGPDYEKAMKLLDAGEVKPALEILARELQHRPKNRPLAREVIRLCEAARLPALADELTHKAVDGGSEVPELLLRYGDMLARNDAHKAMPYYSQAVRGDYAPAEAFIKLGKAYEDLGKTAIAESCWRRAYWSATQPQREEVLRLMGLAEPDGEKKPPAPEP